MLYLFLTLISSVIRVEAGGACNPVVIPVSSDTTLVRTLTRLAEKYDFKLSLPVLLDRPVQLKKNMKLDQLVKFLTRDMNSVLKHKKVNTCATPVLTHLIVLPVGKQAEFVSIAQPIQDAPPTEVQSDDYIYIDNMELYVTEVLKGKQIADVRRMTPEQREEFDIVHEALSAQFSEEPVPVEEAKQADINDGEQQ